MAAGGRVPPPPRWRNPARRPA